MAGQPLSFLLGGLETEDSPMRSEQISNVCVSYKVFLDDFWMIFLRDMMLFYIYVDRQRKSNSF